MPLAHARGRYTMKAIKAILALTLFLVAISAASALSLEVEEVEFDDTRLTSGANSLSIERGNTYDLDVRFTAFDNIDDLEVRAFISGFEYSDIEDISDHTPIFDADENVTYVKRLNLKIPEDTDEDHYKLRLLITDRNGDEYIENYDLFIDVPRNALVIEDIVFNPGYAVKSGSALLTTVRVENVGERDQDDVRVSVSIPGLGISATEYIEEIEDGGGDSREEEETEEIFLRIPKCAKPGNYDVTVDVEFNDRRHRVSERATINVLEDETCHDNDSEKQSTITLGSQVQDVLPGQTAVYPVTVTNAGRNSKTFTVTIQNNDWATVSVTPTSTLVVPKGQTQTIFVNVKPSEDVTPGAHSLQATVASGEHVQELTLTATISEQQKASGLAGTFEIVLLVLVAILVIIGIVLLIGHFRSKEQPETYY